MLISGGPNGHPSTGSPASQLPSFGTAGLAVDGRFNKERKGVWNVLAVTQEVTALLLK